MTATIVSPFLAATHRDARRWNARLLAPTSDPLELNELSSKTKEDLETAIEKGSIELVVPTTCLCGGTSLDPISNQDRFGLPFSTVICRSCGLVRLSPYIAASSLPEYYNRYYHPLHFGRSMTSQALYGKGQGTKVYQRLRPFLSGKRFDVLEVGAGTGSVLRELRASASLDGIEMSVLGTEFSEECITAAKENDIEVIAGGLEEVLQLGHRFDVVVLSHIFEHFVDLDTELERLRNVATQRARFYVEVPGLMNLHRRSIYRYDYLSYVTHAHVWHFNLASLAETFGKQGFRLVQGNEEVEAVFEVGARSDECLSADNCEALLAYLDFVELERERLQSEHDELVRLRKAEKEFGRTTKQLEHVRGLLGKTQKELTTAETKVERVEGSVSWRATRPLRNMRRIIRGLKV